NILPLLIATCVSLLAVVVSDAAVNADDAAATAPKTKTEETRIGITVKGKLPAVAGVSDAPSPLPSPIDGKLAQLIAQVRTQEDRFRNYSVIIKTSREFAPPVLVQPMAGLNFGPSPIRSITEINQQFVQGNRLKFVGEEITLINSGEKITGKRVSVFDGESTVSIEEGNSVTIQAGLVEPPQMLPPHCWGMYFLRVNFPLSVFLGGTEALKLEPKVGRSPIERGTVHEFYKVETDSLGDETIEGLACTKVRVKRWYYSKGEPSIQYLWLARERNLHVARTLIASSNKGVEVVSQATHVTRWQQIAKEVWIPAEVEVEAPPPGPVRDTQRFAVESVAFAPALRDGFFIRPEIPKTLPTFQIGPDLRMRTGDGTSAVADSASVDAKAVMDTLVMTDSPLHPNAAQAAEGTTLDSILNRLAEEEKKYDSYIVFTYEHYAHLNHADFFSGGLTVSKASEENTCVSKNRTYYDAVQTTNSSSGTTSVRHETQSDDGKLLQIVQREGNEPMPAISAVLKLARDNQNSAVRPHTLIFRGERKIQSLATFLRSGWSDVRNKYPLTVEYVCDEIVGELHCHKLKCRTVGDSYSLLWLARDRNLLAVRRENHAPDWTKSLPTGLSYVDDLRELRPGVWFPYDATIIAFQKMGRDGLQQNRLTLQWRYDITVKELHSEFEVKDLLFRLDAPAGTRVGVIDEQGEFLGQFEKSKTGTLEISPEVLLELRQKRSDRK
ncbi:MAG: hypothetical protein JWM11_4047, partial [Planctomycetaceae bacterium]|nr:hypothetical protein [Planctomycetaceae bacterium]